MEFWYGFIVGACAMGLAATVVVMVILVKGTGRFWNP